MRRPSTPWRARYADAFQEVALRPSIEECLHLPFVLRAGTRQELQNALVKEYGAAQGGAIYNHLKAVFQSPEPAEPEKVAKPARPRRNYRRKKTGAEKASE